MVTERCMITVAILTDASNAGGTAVQMYVQAWLGNYSTFAAAMAALEPVAQSANFSVTLSLASSPVLANVGTMPNINLVPTPEPATFALAGLGIASLSAFRRRK